MAYLSLSRGVDFHLQGGNDSVIISDITTRMLLHTNLSNIINIYKFMCGCEIKIFVSMRNFKKLKDTDEKSASRISRNLFMQRYEK